MPGMPVHDGRNGTMAAQEGTHHDPRQRTWKWPGSSAPNPLTGPAARRHDVPRQVRNALSFLETHDLACNQAYGPVAEKRKRRCRRRWVDSIFLGFYAGSSGRSSFGTARFVRKVSSSFQVPGRRARGGGLRSSLEGPARARAPRMSIHRSDGGTSRGQLRHGRPAHVTPPLRCVPHAPNLRPVKRP